ncbi:hypothetical protein [Sphingobacterium sp. FBM7-1]|uniref:hypothetical protein n=1 Tax=Sphingobacterium sp. FBM7-1 TaxID=2886688 RepID=UPI001D1126BF|nr:hypothetical protein [Sphingobacterium sp. FBM7-1]MCC2600468.1 hypothetical protein [Sphingobacterium sp. FBM7-1]
MKRIFLGLLLVWALSPSFAQKKQKVVIPFLSDITIDADLGEWDVMHNVAQESNWFYQLAQDADHLYIAVRVDDPLVQHMAARNGVLLTIQSNQRNRDDIQFLFPYPDNEVKRAMRSEEHAADLDVKTAFISRSRGYLVYGFPTVPNGLLALENGYGIQAIARMDSEKLFYEAVVPKSLLDYIAPVATLKLGVYDGFTPLISTKKVVSGGSRGRYGSDRGRQASRSKDKRTLTVLLETTLD